MTAYQITSMMEGVVQRGTATVVKSVNKPIAGKTGTLSASYGRFTAATSKCAVGKVHAKTGTLTDAVALTGWTRGTDGRVKAFAFVMNGKPTTMTAMRQNIDMLAATVTGCY